MGRVRWGLRRRGIFDDRTIVNLQREVCVGLGLVGGWGGGDIPPSSISYPDPDPLSYPSWQEGNGQLLVFLQPHGLLSIRYQSLPYPLPPDPYPLFLLLFLLLSHLPGRFL